MNLSNLITNVAKTFKANGPEILTALGITGVVSTAYLGAKGAYEASKIIEDNERAGGISDDPKQRFKENFHNTWILYIPAVVSGVGTITCIVLASRGHTKRTAAAVTAFSISEKAFSEYKEKVVEQIGKNKDQKIVDKIAQERVLANPPSSGEVIVLGKGQVLCCELYTHRYFRSDMDALLKAENAINHMIIHSNYVTLDDFYSLLNIPFTEASKNLGWDDDQLVQLVFSAVLSENDEPCLAFNYSYIKPLK